MSKGDLRLQKLALQITKYNDDIITKAFTRADKAKNVKSEMISDDSLYEKKVIVNKLTFGNPYARKKLFEKIRQMHNIYPYISFDSNERKNIKGEDLRHHFTLTMCWKERQRHALRQLESSESSEYQLVPNLGIENMLDRMKRENWHRIKIGIDDIFKNAPEYMLKEKITTTKIELARGTFKRTITKNHFNNIIRKQYIDRYRGMMEMFYSGFYDNVTVRIYWNTYEADLTNRDAKERQVSLELANQHVNNLTLDTSANAAVIGYPTYPSDSFDSKTIHRDDSYPPSAYPPTIHNSNDFSYSKPKNRVRVRKSSTNVGKTDDQMIKEAAFPTAPAENPSAPNEKDPKIDSLTL